MAFAPKPSSEFPGCLHVRRRGRCRPRRSRRLHAALRATRVCAAVRLAPLDSPAGPPEPGGATALSPFGAGQPVRQAKPTTTPASVQRTHGERFIIPTFLVDIETAGVPSAVPLPIPVEIRVQCLPSRRHSVQPIAFRILRLDQVGHVRRLERGEVGHLEVLGVPLDLLAPVAHFAVLRRPWPRPTRPGCPAESFR